VIGTMSSMPDPASQLETPRGTQRVPAKQAQRAPPGSPKPAAGPPKPAAGPPKPAAGPPKPAAGYPGTELVPEDILLEGLCNSFRRPVEIVHTEWQPVEYASTHPIDRLQVRLGSGELLSMIFKRLRSEPVDRGREELPKGNHQEVAIYRHVLADRRFGAPALYASVVDEVHGRYWLFLEDVGEQALEEVGMGTWFAAVRWLAEMHGAYLGREGELRELDCLQEHGPEYYHTIARIARQNLFLAGSAELGRFDNLMKDFEAMVARLSSQPRTLVHGDIFEQNLMVQPGPRIRPIDWESAAIGLPALDLARLLDGWEGQERRSLVSSYLETLELHARAPIDVARIDLALGPCRLVSGLIHLAWELWACQDAAFVDGWLTSMEWSRHHLGKERAGG